MGKKVSLPLYLIGMVLVVVGCFFPLTASKFLGGGTTAFDAITDGSGVLRIGAILAVAGAIAGVAFNFITLKVKLPVKLIALVVSIAGGAYVWFSYANSSGIMKSLTKGALKISGSKPGLGLILIVIGWVVALVGWLQSKD